MRSLRTRLRRLEQTLAPVPTDEFDIEQAVGFRIAGMPRCVVQARYMIALDALAHRKGCPAEVQADCRARVARVVPAFQTMLETMPEASRQVHSDVLGVALSLVLKYGQAVEGADQRGPNNRGQPL